LANEVKAKALHRVIELAPELVTIGLDSDLHVGLPTIRVATVKSKRLHLPWSLLIEPCRPTPRAA